jgi:hypothetical protein
MFPGLFPQVLCFGVDGDMAYFDMEYIPGSVTAFEYLAKTTDFLLIKEFFHLLIEKMDLIHKTELPSCSDAVNLYIQEEVLNKLRDAKVSRIKIDNGEFNNEFVLNGITIDLFDNISFRNDLCKYSETTENFTHGNLTLENILYVPEEKRIVFIDPYEENIIDSKLCDYSQILQSSNSHYELYNAAKLIINKSKIDCSIEVPVGLKRFNNLFVEWLTQKLTVEQLKVVYLFEISQYIRMLPFKLEIDSQKMVFFYAYASKLFNDFKTKYA